ncbi:MAG TPA: ABC transporter permease [Acidimicrobiales bacterium]|nr:ABC transporter permease [Acidimicrobiales bacterium]
MQKLSEFVSRRELFVNLTLRELRSKYKRSILGWTWSLLNPLTSMAIYAVVFGVFLGVDPPKGDPSGLSNFAMYLLCGLLPFNFISNGLNGGMLSLLGNANLVKKVYFPREIIVAANTASWLVSFLIELGVLAVALAFFGNVVVLWIPLILLLVLIELAFVTGLALILAPVTVYFRDLQHLLGLVLQVWFYTAPIVYTMGLVEDQLGTTGWKITLYNLNPLVRFVEAFRNVFYDMRFPPLADIAYLVGVSGGVLFLGLFVFGRLDRRLAEEL